MNAEDAARNEMLDGKYTLRGFRVTWYANKKHHEKLYSIQDEQKAEKAVTWLIVNGAENAYVVAVLDKKDTDEIETGDVRNWTVKHK